MGIQNELPINIFDEMLSIYSQYLLDELICHYHIKILKSKLLIILQYLLRLIS